MTECISNSTLSTIVKHVNRWPLMVTDDDTMPAATAWLAPRGK